MENQKGFPDQRTYNEAPPPFSLALWSATVLRRFLNAGMLAPRIEFGINLVILVASQERRSVRRMPTQIATIKQRITRSKRQGTAALQNLAVNPGSFLALRCGVRRCSTAFRMLQC